LSVSEAIRQSAGWPRAASTQPDLPRPGPRGRQGRPAALPSRAETANRARQADPVTGRGGPSAAGVRARREPEPAVIVVALVRAGSVRHRKPLVLGGHQRSRPRTRIAGHTPSTATTSAGEAAWRRVRAPPPAPMFRVIYLHLRGGRRLRGHHGATRRRPGGTPASGRAGPPAARRARPARRGTGGRRCPG
jgi:hypothetical protein